MIEEHLGGHGGVTNIDPPVLLYLKDRFNLKSMVDIGCGPGGMQEVARSLDMSWFGVDGDHTVVQNTENTRLHDFTKGKCVLKKKFDLAWSVEFLEHVEEQYVDNYMSIFSKAKYVCCTAAPPGATGHHHVNCKDLDYWKDVFEKYKFVYDPEITRDLIRLSKMRKKFFKRSGMFFRKSK